MKLQTVSIDDLNNMAKCREYDCVEINSIIGILSNMGKNAIAKVKTYASGKEVIVIYAYDSNVHRYVVYDEVPIG